MPEPPDNTCSKCGSTKRMSRLPLIDQGQLPGSLKVLLGATRPDAWFLQGPIFATLEADSCGECGYTELYLTDPESAYRDWRRVRQRPSP